MWRKRKTLGAGPFKLAGSIGEHQPLSHTVSGRLPYPKMILIINQANAYAVKLNINDVITWWLIDSGAAVALIKKKILLNLRVRTNKKFILADISAQRNSDNGKLQKQRCSYYERK